MVYLAVLSVAGLFILNSLTQQFGAGIENSMTIQIPVTGSPSRDTARRTEVLQNYSARMVSCHLPTYRLKGWLNFCVLASGVVTQSDQWPCPK